MIDLKNISIDTLVEKYSLFLVGHNRPMIRDYSCEGLFRARIINDIDDECLNTVSSIWYPDWGNIDASHYSFNRCSDKGENMFYASTSLEATLKEIRPNSGDYVMIGGFKSINDITFPAQFASIKFFKERQMFGLNDYCFVSKRDECFDNKIDEAFCKKVDNGEEYFYKSTIALSRILLSHDDIKCLLFPSVGSDLKYHNIVIKHNIVDEFFRCRECWIYQYIEENGKMILYPHKYAYRIIEDSAIGRDSKIEWRRNTEEEISRGRLVY